MAIGTKERYRSAVARVSGLDRQLTAEQDELARLRQRYNAICQSLEHGASAEELDAMKARMSASEGRIRDLKLRIAETENHLQELHEQASQAVSA